MTAICPVLSSPLQDRRGRAPPASRLTGNDATGCVLRRQGEEDAERTWRQDALKITAIEAAPLFGDTPKGGWSDDSNPGDSLHAIVAVYTDAGITGYGSSYTDGRLVQAGLKVLECASIMGENALEPQRVSEKMHQNTF